MWTECFVFLSLQKIHICGLVVRFEIWKENTSIRRRPFFEQGANVGVMLGKKEGENLQVVLYALTGYLFPRT
jgi:hypothetical protein